VSVGVAWLGRVPYDVAWARQLAQRDEVLAGGPDALWLLEHPPVITVGRRASEAGPLPVHGEIPVVHVERGGLATWHGPGQLVGYLIADLPRRGWKVKGVVAGIEIGVSAYLAELGVVAGPRDGYPGVWIGRDKVCAIGLHVRRGVTMHGFALNLTPDLAGFSSILPCGITDGGVTSVARALGSAPSPEGAAVAVGEAVLAGITRWHTMSP
jgi:lipoyl(octanoyl) transferase